MEKRIYLGCVASLVVIAVVMTFFTFTAHALTDDTLLSHNQEVIDNCRNWIDRGDGTTEVRVLGFEETGMREGIHISRFYDKDDEWYQKRVEWEAIRDMALEVTKDLTTDYEKLFAIHTWVAENIWYDHDDSTRLERGRYDTYPYGVFSTRNGGLSGSHGYAALTTEMLSTIGIPAIKVFANESGFYGAFIDGILHIGTSEGDSNNRIINGETTSGPSRNEWFDLSAEEITDRGIKLIYGRYITSVGLEYGDEISSLIVDGWIVKADYIRIRPADGFVHIIENKYTGAAGWQYAWSTPLNAIPYAANNEVVPLVTINEKPLILKEDLPVIKDNRTLVPLRAIFEALSATVEWNQDTQTVTAVRGNTTIELTIGEDVMYVNGKDVKLDVPSQIILTGGHWERVVTRKRVPVNSADPNGYMYDTDVAELVWFEGTTPRTYVPVRAISEAFGIQVDWEQNTQTVIITDE